MKLTEIKSTEWKIFKQQKTENVKSLVLAKLPISSICKITLPDKSILPRHTGQLRQGFKTKAYNTDLLILLSAHSFPNYIYQQLYFKAGNRLYIQWNNW